LGRLADKTALDSFLSHSEERGFKFNDQWNQNG